VWATSRPPSPCARPQARFRAGGSNNVAGVLSCIPTPSTSPAEPFYARSAPVLKIARPAAAFSGLGTSDAAGMLSCIPTPGPSPADRSRPKSRPCENAAPLPIAAGPSRLDQGLEPRQPGLW
jgi:hypothetical protein